MFQVGSEADIVFDALPDQTFLGKVIQVNPILDKSTSTSVVGGLVQMTHPANLLMGMSASVDVHCRTDSKRGALPLAALHEYIQANMRIRQEKWKAFSRLC